MSVQYNSDAGTDDFHYHGSAAPNGTTFTVAAWIRCDAVVAGKKIIGPDANSGALLNSYKLAIENPGLRIYNAGTASSDLGDNWTTTVWRYCVLSRSGSDPNGILMLRWLDTAETSFGSGTITGLTALTPTMFGINTYRSSSSGDGGRFTFAFVKVWSGVELSDADALSERLYRNIQTNTGSVWAHYKFANGALTTDSSGNGRDLTPNGSPAYTSDEPAAILGDDPASGATYYVVSELTISSTEG